MIDSGYASPKDLQATSEAAPGGSAGGTMALLTPDPGIMIWVWVSFGILLLLLRKFAWRPILNGVADRERTLRSAIEQAEAVARQARESEALGKAAFEAARAEADRIVQEQRVFAASLREKAEADARTTSDRIQAETREALEIARHQVHDQLRREAALLSVELAGKLLRREVGDGRQVTEELLASTPERP